MKKMMLGYFIIIFIWSVQNIYAYETTKIKEELKNVNVFTQGIQDNIKLSGSIKYNYSYLDYRDRDDEYSGSTSDLFISEVELGIQATVNNYLHTNIIFKMEDIDKSKNNENNDNASDPDNPFIDEAIITFRHEDKLPIYSVLGKRGQPFGNFFTHTISDPVTKNAYEINTTGVTIGYFKKDLLDISLTVYKGEKVINQITEIGDGFKRKLNYSETDEVDSYIVNFTLSSIENLTIGMAFDSEPGSNERNNTLNIFTELLIYGFNINAELFIALTREEYNNMSKEYMDNAFVFGIAYQCTDFLEIAGRYESFNNGLPSNEKRNGDFNFIIAIGMSYKLNENLIFMGEYRYLKEKSSAGSNYKEIANELNFNVSMEF